MARRDSLSVRLWRGLTRALSPVLGMALTWLYARDLSLPLKEFRARVPVEVGKARETELDEIARVAATSVHEAALVRARDEVRARIAGGARCFVARMNGAIVHVNWLIFGRMEHWPRDELVTPLRPGEVYCTDGVTVESARGKGIHTEVLRAMLHYLQQAGYRRAYTIVDHENEASWKTHVRLDWELSGFALQVRPRWSRKIRLVVVVWGLAGKAARMHDDHA